MSGETFEKQMLETSFEIAGKGRASAVLEKPDGAIALLVLGHGAGADMRHHHMQSLADGLAAQGIASFRFNFPFREAGKNRVDPQPVCIDTIGSALEAARDLSALPCLLGGHSFGGRMASHFAAEEKPDVRGLIYFSFPLHPANKPDTKRADHLPDIELPQLFLSGTRDALADLPRLRNIVSSLTGARLHELETADHGFRILKRTRQSEEDVYSESARIAREFIVSSLPDLERP